MAYRELKDICLKDDATVAAILIRFCKESSSMFTLNDLISEKEIIWRNIFQFLQKDVLKPYKISCLSTVRLLCRDKNLLTEPGISKDDISILLRCACLFNNSDMKDADFEVVIEATQCFCNILINANHLFNHFCNLNGVDSLINRIKCYKTIKPSTELAYFDMRLLFLVTALSPMYRKKIFSQWNGIKLMLDYLVNITSRNQISSFNRMQFMTCSEVFQIVFNLLMCYENETKNDELETDVNKIIILSKDFLLVPPQTNVKYNKFQIDIINLLTVIPTNCMLGLLDGLNLKVKEISLDDTAMLPLKRIINILDVILTEHESNKGGEVEPLSPILLALLNLSRAHRLYRKYFRQIILPHLRDVFRRPEEGDTLRNKLCRLLTSPDTAVSELVSSWLFVLCKEKVSRMIKYTGYGNCAGLFARHGFPSGPPEYSSSSEDSDTEEYLSNQPEINPVVGCRMSPHENPMKNMTEEQKECLAMELVNSIDKLEKCGLIRPCKIGDDGKPTPVSHILELQDSKLPVTEESDD